MKWLSDQVVDQLRAAIDLPEGNDSRYRVMRLLARGGMGAVWLAEDTALNRQVALKILNVSEESGDLAARLAREAEVLASLEHPGIVPIHDAGTLPDGRRFYCMKYVQGKTLDQYAAGPATVSERLRLIQRIAEPMALAHSRGVLHRDLKPSNIMIGPFGEVLVMDWGLAKRSALAHCDSQPTLPALGHPLSDGPPTGVVGTPGYMPPEQERGEATDTRSDVFSLGAVMRFLLTQGNVQRISSLPRALAAICAKATSPDSGSRYQSVEELSADISKFLEQSPVSAYKENLFDRMGRLARRHGIAVVLVLAYLLMRTLFIIFAKR